MALPVKISPDYVVNITNIQGLGIRNIHEKYERFISYCPGVIIKVKGSPPFCLDTGSKITFRSLGNFPWCHLKEFQKFINAKYTVYVTYVSKV